MTLSGPHGALHKTVSRDEKKHTRYNELLSSVINVGGETLHAQIHREDTLCGVRA